MSRDIPRFQPPYPTYSAASDWPRACPITGRHCLGQIGARLRECLKAAFRSGNHFDIMIGEN